MTGLIKNTSRTLCFALCLSFSVMSLAGCSVFPSQNNATKSPNQRTAHPEWSEPKAIGTHQDVPAFAGLKTDSLFAEKISNSRDRFDRLEMAVQDMHNEITPSIDRLTAIENDIKILAAQQKVLLGVKTAAPKPKARVTTPKAAPKRPYTPHTGTPILKKIRMSDNPKSTRLVLETRGKMKYSAELDNSEQLLMLFFETGEASEAIPKTRLRSRLIKAISPSPQTEGLILAVSLNAHSRIIKQGVIAPSDANHNYRIYIDLAN